MIWKWTDLSSSLWENRLPCNLFIKKQTRKITATNNWIVLTVQWSVKYYFATNSPIFQKNRGEEEYEENMKRWLYLSESSFKLVKSISNYTKFPNHKIYANHKIYLLKHLQSCHFLPCPWNVSFYHWET